jgi:threonine aldolase
MARRLAAGLSAIPGVRIAYPVEANAVFPALSQAIIERLLKQYRFYAWDEAAGVVRFMCSWQTTPAEVDELIAAVREAVAAVR